jgi:hypothetical protein
VTAEPTSINGKSYVRLRQKRVAMPPFNLITYILTPVKSRSVIKQFPMESMARLHAKNEGWIILGGQ